MNKHALYIASVCTLLLFYGYKEKPRQNENQKINHLSRLAIQLDSATKVSVDIDKSIIRWKGTKMLRTGKHEGTVNLKEGILYFENYKLTCGYLIADMKSIKITDIPPDDIVPIRNLTAHLNNDFATTQYPTSIFRFDSVKQINKSRVQLFGNLTIRGITRAITAKVEFMFLNEKIEKYKTSLILNRNDWEIGEEGSWLEKKLVDDEFELNIEIVTE